MHITRNDEAATWTLVSTSDAEKETLAAIASSLPLGGKMNYNGRSTYPDDENAVAIRFNAGGQQRRQTHTNEHGGSIIYTVYDGGVTFDLFGSTTEDKHELACVRNTCYFGSGGLIFVEQTEVDGELALVFTAKHCKHCGAPMLRMARCEGNTCDACVEKCDHEYKRGAIHGGSIDIGVGEFCVKCGAGKPRAEGEKDKTPLQHALDAESELGVLVVDKDTGMSAHTFVEEARTAGVPLNL